MRVALSVLPVCLLLLLLPRCATDLLASPVDGGEARDLAAREVVCSQPGMLSDPKMPADSAEVANDCGNPGVGAITQATWWGGYINWQPGDPEFTTFNVAFYTHEGSQPGTYIVRYESATPQITPLGPCEDGWPCFRYDLAVEVPVQGERIWFSVKAIRPVGEALRPYPPKWGRLGDEVFEGFGSVIGFGETGEWVTAPMDPEWDASQEFDLEQPTATAPATWGVLRTLYR